MAATADDSIDFDSLLDDDFDFDPDSVLVLPAPPPPPPARPQPPRPQPPRPLPPPAPKPKSAGPGTGTGARTILRPPVPPRAFPGSASQRSAAAVGGAAAGRQQQQQQVAPQPPPAKRPRIMGEAAGAKKQWITPNPFHPPPAAATVAAPVPPEEEEEMPEITLVGDDGGYVARVVPPPPPPPPAAASNTNTTNAPPPPGRDLTALRQWGQPSPSTSSHPPLAANANFAEKELIQDLKQERLMLLRKVQESEEEKREVEGRLRATVGEVAIVRGRLHKSEAAHAAALSSETRIKSFLEEKLQNREKEFRKLLELRGVEEAFRRQEIETSARRLGASQWNSSSANRRRSGSQPPQGGLMGPPPLPGSPSAGRQKGGLGFKSGFEDSPVAIGPGGDGFATSTARRGPLGAAAGENMVTPRKKASKGKGVMLVEEAVVEEEEEMMADDEGWPRAQGEEEEEEVDLMSSGGGELDTRTEIISSLFTHTTYIHLDAESSTAPPLPHSSSRLLHGSTSGSSYSLTRSTFAHGATSRSTGRLAHPDPTPPPPTTPVPTFHALTNLRFPSSTLPAISAAYEELCREVFGVLGRKGESDLHQHDEAATQAFVNALAHCLEGMAIQLDRAALVGPLIQLLALVSNLVLLFPSFSLYFLNDSAATSLLSSTAPQAPHTSKFIPLLARLLKRFGRPPSPAKVAADLASTPGGASLSLNGGGKGKAKERSRRVRGVIMRPQQVMNGAGAGGKAKDGEEDRIELDAVKRERLVGRILDCLEGLAWRGGESMEEQFVPFLEHKEAVATLLDPHQPLAVLTSSIRFLALLACRLTLFRHLVAVKFVDATDVRGSKVPIFDRVGSLLVRNSGKGPLHQVFTLDACLISFITILSTKHDDAIVFISSSPSLIPELLEKVFKDTRTVYEHDGKDVSPGTLQLLKHVVSRLSSSVHLFYYLTCAPTSTLKIGEFFTQSSFLGLHDRFNVAFGMLSFASLPDWAEQDEAAEEGRKLVELGYLAQEIMEDVSPQEAEEMECCFASDQLDFEGAAELGVPNGGPAARRGVAEGDSMVVDGDDEMVLRDLSQG